jgi:peroxiredoxin Q/BCP
MDAEVVGISSDLPAVHRHFAEKYELSLTLLSDPMFNVMSNYGAWVQSRLGQQTYGHIIRSTYIIDPEGRIRYHCPEVIPMGHASRIRKKLEELQQQVPDS